MIEIDEGRVLPKAALNLFSRHELSGVFEEK